MVKTIVSVQRDCAEGCSKQDKYSMLEVMTGSTCMQSETVEQMSMRNHGYVIM